MHSNKLNWNTVQYLSETHAERVSTFQEPKNIRKIKIPSEVLFQHLH